MKRYWISVWACNLSAFEYHGPWWVSGERGFGDEDIPEQSVCAAVQAKSAKEAVRALERAWDKGHCHGEVRFVSERPDDWEPFTDRFIRKPWMKWPWPAAGDTKGSAK